VALSPHIARLRAAVGHDQLVLPAVSVLPVDEHGRVLLARHADGDHWGLVGGAVEPGESPAETAVREAREEIGVEVRLRRLVDVFGGPDFEVTYGNGDQVAYVIAVFEAEIAAGTLTPDGDEIVEAAWFDPASLAGLNVRRLARAVLRRTGHVQA
jgi:8-oxo-dGTP pyrophosphatase MutT (NUDIX family)